MFRPNISIFIGGIPGEIGRKCLLSCDRLAGEEWKNNLRFFFFDVDEIEDADLPSYLKLTEAQKFYLPITQAEINTMQADPENYPIIKEKPTHVSVKQILKGGGGIPYCGYLAFHYYYPTEIERKLETLLRDFFKKQALPLQKRGIAIQVNIIASSCGSSRGMTVDLVRAVKELILDLGHTPFISLFIISPIGFSGASDYKKKLKLSYGFVKELCAIVEKEEIFDFIHFVDTDSDEGGNLSGLLALEDLLADYLLMTFRSTVATKADRLNQNARNKVVSGINADGARTAFSRLSVNKIAFPASQVKRSCEARLGYEILEMWLGKEKKEEELDPSFGLGIDTVRKKIGLSDTEEQIHSRIELLKKEKPTSLIDQIKKEREYHLNPIIARFEIDSQEKRESYEKEAISKLEDIVKLGLSSPSIPLLTTTGELQTLSHYCLGQDSVAVNSLKEEREKLETEENIQQIQKNLEKSLSGLRRVIYILGFRKKAKEEAKELIQALERLYHTRAGKIATEQLIQFYLDISPAIQKVTLQAEAHVNNIIKTKNLLKEKHTTLNKVSSSPLNLTLYNENEFNRYYKADETTRRNILAQLCQDNQGNPLVLRKSEEALAEYICNLVKKQGTFDPVKRTHLWDLFEEKYSGRQEQKEIIQVIFGEYSSPLCPIDRAYPHSKAAEQVRVEKVELFGIPDGSPAKKIIKETLGVSETNIVSLPPLEHQLALVINEHALPAHVFNFVKKGWKNYKDDPAKGQYHSARNYQNLPDFPWKNTMRHK